MELHFISKLNDGQVEELYELFQQAWWTDKRKIEDIRTMLGHTDMIFGACEKDTGKLIGFARVLTDFVYKALLLDVIIDEPIQNQGVGASLLNHIMKHSKLKNVHHIELYCKPDKIAFYKKWGFTEELNDLTFMRKISL